MNSNEELCNANKDLNTILCTNGVDYLLPSNFQKLRSIFKEWSTPFSFIESGEYKNFYWAHRSVENYIRFLSFSLYRVMSSCLTKPIEQAQATKWEY